MLWWRRVRELEEKVVVLESRAQYQQDQLIQAGQRMNALLKKLGLTINFEPYVVEDKGKK